VTSLSRLSARSGPRTHTGFGDTLDRNPAAATLAAVTNGVNAIRRIALLLVTVFSAGSLLGCGANKNAAHASEPTRLTIMTYNIHHGAGMDGRIDLARIAAVIRAADPDFVALQEVDQGTKRAAGVDQPAELARLTDMHVFYGAAMDYDGGKYGDAVLARRPIVASRAVALPWTNGGQREPRVAVSATTSLPDDAGHVEFISTHWDHTREPSDRLIQAEKVNETWKGAPAATILAGDFNCPPDSAPIKALAEQWTLVSGADPADPTCCGGETLKSKIDHVFVKPSGRWRIIEHRVVDEPTASDHRPVVVTLELERK
jgi:endonuclease/exonuclease/phosphatase family metal-dependent hydrolase